VQVVAACAGAAAIGMTAGASAAVAAPTTLYVDQANAACNDAGAGTAALPFCTIVRAAKVAAAGQTVLVASGTYTGDVSVGKSGAAGAPIVLTAAPGASVTVGGGTDGFKVSSKSWVTINGFTVTGTTGAGIYLTSATNVVVSNNRVTASGQPVNGLTARGIRLANTSSSTITHNTADHNTDAGIGVSGLSNDNTISGNVSFANARGYTRAAAGFDIRDGARNVVTGNVSHDNEDSGFNVWTGSSGTIATNNVAYRNGDHGIDVHDATNAVVVANTVHGNSDSGIEMTTSTGTYLANNLSTDNGVNSPRTSGQIRADAASIGTATLDSDLVNLSVPGVMIDWAGAKYPSLAAFRTATGREPNGVQGDPRYVSAPAGNFRLTAGSPAIDAANSAATAQPATDADGRSRVDDPATPNTGLGPLPYVDRGAFEYQPA
jgi:parallel beta-helix repeat protein